VVVASTGDQTTGVIMHCLASDKKLMSRKRLLVCHIHVTDQKTKQ